jgi:hypothetical protein
MTETEKENNQTQTSDDGTEFRIIRPSALEAIERAEIDVAISTAKQYPRDIANSIKQCKELALRTPQIAKTCNYAVPRGGKMIIGPSVHFARIVAYAWGNQTALARVIGCDHNDAHLQGVFHDLQSNSRIGIEMDWPVQAPHTETPQRWKDQMSLAKRAGAAVALRTAIFNCVPMALFIDISETAKLVAVGEGKTFLEQRDSAISEFKGRGITQEMLYNYLEVGGLESIKTDHLIHLHALLQALVDQTVTIFDVFGDKETVFEKSKTPKGQTVEKPEKPAQKPAQKPLKTEQDDFLDVSPPEDARKKKPAPKPPEKAEKIFQVEKPLKEEPKHEVSSPSEPETLPEKVRARLNGEKIDESQVVTWLIAVQCMSAGQTKLEQCKATYLEALLGKWDQSIELITKFFQEESA